MNRLSIRVAVAVGAALLFALALGVAAVKALPGPASAAEVRRSGPVRIMPLGDSITGNPGCWRALLWTTLRKDGYTRIDMVGSRGRQDCPHYPPIYADHDGDNEGHGGFRVTEVAAEGLISQWMAQSRPDVVLMHFGTNDLWNGISADAVLRAYGTVVGQMRKANPAVAVLIAQILPMAPSNCPACAERVRALNARIPAWAAHQKNVTVVDQWTGFNAVKDTRDGVHPNDSGNIKIAARWAAALERLLR